MTKDKSEKKKWKSYISGIFISSIMSSNKLDKYFRMPISESTAKAIQENWIRILGIDNEIISMNLCKENKPLGIALEGRNEISRDAQEVIQRHFLRAIIPNLCIGATHKFMVKDELLEVNGLKIMGLPTKEVIRSLKKVTNHFQIVVARSKVNNYDMASDYGGSEDNLNSPISFYDIDEDESSRCGTLRSSISNFSTTSRDFGSSVSFGGLIDGQYANVREYLRNIAGWRGPIVLEFRKQKETLGMALEEISDPRSSQMIIVFKTIVPQMKAGRDGRLHVGDRLLQVNGKPISGTPFRKVCQWMKSAPDGRLVICICKPHFESTGFNVSSENEEKYLYNTLQNPDKLPKLPEETDGNVVESPAIPDCMEKQLTLKRTGNKLGIFFDVVDNGKNGSRIKKITHGIVQEDGRLREGDFITSISCTSLRVDNKLELNNSLKKIVADTQDYQISYITAEDIALYQKQESVPMVEDNSAKLISSIYPDPLFVKIPDTQNNNFTDKAESPTLAFETFDVVIQNDHQTGLGLVISPSLKEPMKYISITDIHENSLCDKTKLLNINDDILMVNNTTFENKSIKDAGNFLKNAIITEDVLKFRVRRLVSSDDENRHETVFDESVRKLNQFPDIYFCSITKGPTGYGFSIIDLDSNRGVVVEKIDLNSVASKINEFKCGDKFIMINKCYVNNCSKITIMQMVKKSTKLDLIMERSKYREFTVKILKDSSLLGLNVGGGMETKSPMPIIESLLEYRTSVFSEELFRGDFIVEVNNKSMYGLSHDQVIQILRTIPYESIFKILRPLPFVKRHIFDNFEIPDFPHIFLRHSMYSVALNKPTDDIRTFGIHFTDVVIVDPTNVFSTLSRFKAVLNIEKNSLAENYAKKIKPFHFLVSINSVPVNSDILCEDLKTIIDKENRIDFVFSTEIPYNIKDEIKDYDSPILLHKSNDRVSLSDDSSIEENNIETLNECNPDGSTEIINEVKGLSAVSEFEIKNNISAAGCPFNIIDNLHSTITEEHFEKSLKAEDGKEQLDEPVTFVEEPTKDFEENHNSKVEPETLVQEPSENLEENHEDNKIESETFVQEPTENHEDNKIEPETFVQEPAKDLKENPENDKVDHVSANDKKRDKEQDKKIISELGINIDYIKILKLQNMELGFQIFGGKNDDNAETLPVFVIGVEQDTCNWPTGQAEPYLKNGYQLIELNGTDLSSLKLSKIENMIQTAEDELTFKVLKFK